VNRAQEPNILWKFGSSDHGTEQKPNFFGSGSGSFGFDSLYILFGSQVFSQLEVSGFQLQLTFKKNSVSKL